MSKDNPFDPALVRELATMIAETDLTEIEVEKGDLRIRVARTITAVAMPVAAPAAAAPVVAPPPVPVDSLSSAKAAAATANALGRNGRWSRCAQRCAAASM